MIVSLGEFRHICTFFFLCLPASLLAQSSIEFYTVPTVHYRPVTVVPRAVDFADTLGADTLYQVRAQNGAPVSYHRKIETSVCFDNKCRLLNIVVHWNITGRYLGFSLPPGEFLSKAEHKPFTRQEYVRLHSLLQDPNSPLGGFSYNELVPEKPRSGGEDVVDAVSSPTAKNLLAYVVEGAAYTTYRLWHIVHGTSQQAIDKLTGDLLTPELLEEILRSPEVSDQLWALDQRHRIHEPAPEVQEMVLSFVRSNQFTLADRAIQSINARDLQKEEFQLTLVETLDSVNYNFKKLIVGKLKEAPVLGDRVVIQLAERLDGAEGSLVTAILDLFEERGISNTLVCERVAQLLQNKNMFVSRQAYAFLSRTQVKDKDIKRRMTQYAKKHDLDSGG